MTDSTLEKSSAPALGLSWKIGLAVILGFWLLVSLGDYPAPFIDDLSYIGAAINLVQHGAYSNPYCEMLTTIGSGPGQLFLDYMPVENYVLAGWLKIFGISTLSFHVLFVLLALGASLLMYQLLPPTRYSAAAAVVICIAVFGLLGGTGLRADALGLCFYLMGVSLFAETSPMGFFGKNLFLGAVVITFPNLALLAMLTSLAGLLYLYLFRGKTIVELLSYVLFVGMAYLICFVIFLLCIQGHLWEFLDITIRNQKLSAMGVAHRFQFFTPLGISKWVVAQAAFAALAIALIIRWRKEPARRQEVFFISFALLAFLVLGYSSVNSATGAHVWAFGCLMTALYILMQELWDWRAWTVYAGILFVAAFGHYHIAIQHVLASAQPSEEKKKELLAEISSLNPPKLYVDVYALREIYDYNMPPNSFAFETSNSTGWGDPKSAETLPKGTVSIVSVSRAFPTMATPKGGSTARPLRIFGHEMPGVTQNPYDLEVLDNR